DMRKEISVPALLEKLACLERQASELRRLDRPMTEAQLRQVEQEELKGTLVGTTRLAAQMITGKRATPKVPSFLTWIISHGGIRDTGGDVLAALGGTTRTRPGLINQAGLGADKLAIRIQEAAPGHFP